MISIRNIHDVKRLLVCLNYLVLYLEVEKYPCIADMTETRKKSPEVASNTVTVLLAKQAEHLVDGHRVKVVVVGSAPKGVAVAIAILFKVGGFSIFF